MLRAHRHPQPRRLHRLPLAPAGAFAALLSVLIFAGFFPVHVHGTATEPLFAANRLSLPGLPSASGAGAGSELAARAVPLTIVAPQVTGDAVLSAQNSTDAARQALLQQQQNGQGSGGPAQQQADRTPIFYEYKVQNGDTVTGIAARFGISTRSITWNNVDIISDVDSLTPGMTLQIPSVEGIIHSVRFGETVSEIAARYDARSRDIVEFRANGLAGDPNRLRDGSLILVPGGRIVPLAPATRPTPPPTVQSAGPAAAAPQAGPATTTTVSTAGWVWPGSGPMTSPFGPSHPLGIDIGTGYGAAIVAARDGIISFAGGNPCCSYGYHVIIAHDGGYETLYAHFSSITVQIGQKIRAGEIIGYSGTSGRVTGPHLHFELRRNGVHQNPSAYLP